MWANYSAEVTARLATGGWGWHIDTATHLLRLILSGAFDRFPTLQIIIGHMGEGLPFMLPRFDLALPPAVTKLERPISDYLRQNVFIDPRCSGNSWIGPPDSAAIGANLHQNLPQK
jgi:hypothetical protein